MAQLRLAGKTTRPLPRKINFTVSALAGLTCPAGKDRTYIYDAKTPGLAFLLTSKGGRSFYLVRKVAGRTERIRLGGIELSIDLARKQAVKFNGEISTGGDPQALKRASRRSDTLQGMFDRWLKEHAKVRLKPKTLVTDKSRFDTCFEGWKTRRVLGGINEADVRAIHAKIGKDRGHVSANRAIQLLRRLYSWARLGVNPVKTSGVELFRESTRERFVQPDELPRLFKAMDAPDINPTIRDFLYVCLFTGARRSNVAAMRDDQIDLTRASWTIPGTSSKNHKPMTFPLTDPVFSRIKARMGHESGFIFPGTGKSGHLEDPKSTWAKILKEAELEGLRLHDLRRTLGSYQAAMGASLPVIGASLGHRNPAATAIYSRLHLDPVRASVTGAVEAMIESGKAKKKGKKK
jgi:integrase